MFGPDDLEDMYQESLNEHPEDRTPQLVAISGIGVMEWSEWIKHPQCTCSDCEDKDDCQFAYDHYNTNGDCLAVK